MESEGGFLSMIVKPSVTIGIMVDWVSGYCWWSVAEDDWTSLPPPSHHVPAFVWQNGWALEPDSLGIDIRLDRPQFCAFVYISERAWWFLCQGYCQCESQILDGHFHCTHLTPINQSLLSPCHNSSKPDASIQCTLHLVMFGCQVPLEFKI